jgi:hypothetical protein
LFKFKVLTANKTVVPLAFKSTDSNISPADIQKIGD